MARVYVVPVTRFVARCSCGWEQQHMAEANATRDGLNHIKEWHDGGADDLTVLRAGEAG